MEIYNTRIVESRQRKGLTQQKAAECLGIQQQQLSRYEKGTNEIPVRYLVELCKLYEVTPNWVLGWEE